MSSADYAYEPLTSRSSFRVFRLLPIQPDLQHDSNMEIELFEADLDRPPAYEAISYAWGQEKARATVICNGKHLLVTSNVLALLQALRQPGSPRTLWLDSIAIDQSSIAERNIQVPRMRSIYRQAAKVWIWLGEGSYEVNVAFKYILDITTIWQRQDVSRGSGQDLMAKVRDVFHAKVRQARGHHDPIDTSFIMDILNLSWFRRTWTVQELVLARDAAVLLGTESIPWNNFRTTLRYIENSERDRQFGNPMGSITNPADFGEKLACFQGLQDLVDLELSETTVRRKTVYEPLKLVRTQISSDPKDKVYGLYGIFDQLGIPRLPCVDYAKSVQQVYTEITRAAIEVDRSLEILQELHVPSSIPKLPSWVPDWSNTVYVRPLDLQHNPKSKWLEAEVSRRWQGSASPVTEAEFHDAELILSGMLIDKIVDTASSSSIPSPGFRRGHHARREDLGSAVNRQLATTELVRTLQNWIRYSKSFEAKPGGVDKTAPETESDFTNQPSNPTFHRTLRYKGPHWGPGWEMDLQGCKDFAAILTAGDAESNIDLATFQERIRHEPAFAAIKDDFVQILGCSAHEEDWSDEMKIRLLLKVFSAEVAYIQHEVTLITYNRTLFTTRDGYLGMGPRWARTEDYVAQLAGSECPFIVRKEGSKYRFVGPAKIHGVMQGERWDPTKLEKMAFV